MAFHYQLQWKHRHPLQSTISWYLGTCMIPWPGAGLMSPQVCQRKHQIYFLVGSGWILRKVWLVHTCSIVSWNGVSWEPLEFRLHDKPPRKGLTQIGSCYTTNLPSFARSSWHFCGICSCWRFWKLLSFQMVWMIVVHLSSWCWMHPCIGSSKDFFLEG